jgi:uncharacterized protein (DUF4415 family)
MKKLKAMKDSEIDFSDIRPITPEMFARSIVRSGLKPVIRKEQLTIRVDSDVLAWFKAHGRGYQTQINELLRAYMKEHIARSTR